MVVSINLFDTNSRVDDLYEELAVRNTRTSKVADDLIKVDDLIFNLTQSGSMSRDQKTELEGYINDLLTSANALLMHYKLPAIQKKLVLLKLQQRL